MELLQFSTEPSTSSVLIDLSDTVYRRGSLRMDFRQICFGRTNGDDDRWVGKAIGVR